MKIAVAALALLISCSTVERKRSRSKESKMMSSLKLSQHLSGQRFSKKCFMHVQGVSLKFNHRSSQSTKNSACSVIILIDTPEFYSVHALFQVIF